mmetsp:Transcript_15712/g.39190  ORF Transcript_15712/g.39190 Transcript_15712/m.39190 type:complete len:259 (+) Transcript_15712:171-947(+)
MYQAISQHRPTSHHPAHDRWPHTACEPLCTPTSTQQLPRPHALDAEVSWLSCHTLRSSSHPLGHAPSIHPVLSKQVGWVGHGLELNGIVGGVMEKHGPLLTRLALEPEVRLNDKLEAGPCPEAGGQRMELVHRQRHTKVWHRHCIAIHRIRAVAGVVTLNQVRHDLVTIEIEIHPCVGGPPLAAAQHPGVKGARFLDVPHGERDVERLDGCAWLLLFTTSGCNIHWSPGHDHSARCCCSMAHARCPCSSSAMCDKASS